MGTQPIAAPPVEDVRRLRHRAMAAAPTTPRSAESYRREAEALHESAMLAEFNGTYEVAREHRAAAARALQAARDAEGRKS